MMRMYTNSSPCISSSDVSRSPSEADFSKGCEKENALKNEKNEEHMSKQIIAEDEYSRNVSNNMMSSSPPSLYSSFPLKKGVMSGNSGTVMKSKIEGINLMDMSSMANKTISLHPSSYCANSSALIKQKIGGGLNEIVENDTKFSTAGKIKLSTSSQLWDNKGEMEVLYENPNDAMEKMMQGIVDKFPPNSQFISLENGNLNCPNNISGIHGNMLTAGFDYQTVKALSKNFKLNEDPYFYHAAPYSQRQMVLGSYNTNTVEPLTTKLNSGYQNGTSVNSVSNTVWHNPQNYHSFRYLQGYHNNVIPSINVSGVGGAVNLNQHSLNCYQQNNPYTVWHNGNLIHHTNSHNTNLLHGNSVVHTSLPITQHHLYHGGAMTNLKTTQMKRKDFNLTENRNGGSVYYCPMFKPVSRTVNVNSTDITRYIPKTETKEIVREIPKFEVEWIEKVIEVPQVQYVDKYEEIEQMQEVIKTVPKLEIIEVPRETIKYVPKIETKIVEQVVEVPRGEKIAIPRVYPVDSALIVPKFADKEVPIVVSQTMIPEIEETDDILEVEVAKYAPQLVPVDVFVPKPVTLPLVNSGLDDRFITQRLTHSSAFFIERRDVLHRLMVEMNPHIQQLELYNMLQNESFHSLVQQSSDIARQNGLIPPEPVFEPSFNEVQKSIVKQIDDFEIHSDNNNHLAIGGVTNMNNSFTTNLNNNAVRQMHSNNNSNNNMILINQSGNNTLEKAGYEIGGVNSAHIEKTNEKLACGAVGMDSNNMARETLARKISNSTFHPQNVATIPSMYYTSSHLPTSTITSSGAPFVYSSQASLGGNVGVQGAGGAAVFHSSFIPNPAILQTTQSFPPHMTPYPHLLPSNHMHRTSVFSPANANYTPSNKQFAPIVSPFPYNFYNSHQFIPPQSPTAFSSYLSTNTSPLELHHQGAGKLLSLKKADNINYINQLNNPVHSNGISRSLSRKSSFSSNNQNNENMLNNYVHSNFNANNLIPAGFVHAGRRYN